MNPKLNKYMKRIGITVLAIITVLFLTLFVYSRNPYQPLDEMSIQIALIENDSVTVSRDFDEIRYTVENPMKHILFMPGGLVEPESYEFLAYNLALEGYNVTIFKPFFDLAILTPNYALRFLDEDFDNIVIGHSLGGVVGSILSSGEDLVSTVIFLGSYPIKDLTDKNVLLITAEHDDGMDPESFEDSLQYTNDLVEIYDIDGGNHAQFGWYGPQKGDGEATISTLSQQLIVIQAIIPYLQAN